MPSPISDKQIARARKVLNDTLTEPVTIERTGVETFCRIGAVKMREVQVAGLPGFMRGRLWQILFKFDEEVDKDDRLIVPAKGNYQAVGLGSPATIDIMHKVFALHEDNPDIFRVITDQASFRQRTSDEDIGPFPVTCDPLDRAARVNNGEWIFTHEVSWKETDDMVFSDGQQISSGDRILLPWLKSGVADLDYPRRYPAIGYVVSNFRDS